MQHDAEYALAIYTVTYVSIPQHTSAYVSIRPHTSAHVYAGAAQHDADYALATLMQEEELQVSRMLTYADVC